MSKLEHVHPNFITTSERTAKMMAIMLGITIAGGAIFFGMWDYWISAPPPAASLGVVEGAGPAAFTGKEIPITLNFIESSDFRTLAFNALPGDPDNNPTINAEIGDKIVFDVNNAGVSFHSFGVTAQAEGITGMMPGSEVASASNPLKPGESGTSEFIPGEEGIYYYICTVPGHREQGMVGQIIVGDVSADTQMMAPEPEPEVMAEPEPEVMAEPEPEVMAEPEPMTTFSGTISLPSGSGVPGCDETNECYIPAEVSINVGDTVTWSNDDTAAHTVTSGTPTDGPDGVFDSSLFMADTTFEYTFVEAGEYNYFCMVHPWMVGTVQVN
jgi:plastocyanin